MHKLTSETLQAVPLRGQIPSRWGFLCSALKGPETRTCLLVGGRCSSLREDRPVEGLRDCPWGPPLLPCARCKDHFSLCSPPALAS